MGTARALRAMKQAAGPLRMIAGLALGFLVVFSMTSVWGWEFLPHWVARHLAFVEHLATHLYRRWPMWTLLASAILLTVAYCLVLGVGRTFYMIQVPIYFWIPPGRHPSPSTGFWVMGYRIGWHVILPLWVCPPRPPRDGPAGRDSWSSLVLCWHPWP